jgi:hypothetical protein
MTTPQYIHIQIRRPRKDDPTDGGVIEEGWYVVTDNSVQLTDRDGNKLHGELTRRPIGPGETAKEVAVRMLRTRVMSRPRKSFNRPLRYFNAGKI